MMLLDPTVRLMTAALQVLGRRHSLLAANVANIQTPGYSRADLDFASALRAALARDDPHSPASRDLDATLDAFVVKDGSAADLELETAEVARNSLQMMALTTLVAMKLEHLRAAITEGRR